MPAPGSSLPSAGFFCTRFRGVQPEAVSADFRVAGVSVKHSGLMRVTTAQRHNAAGSRVGQSKTGA
ncbi:hypothetical protein BN439_1813 [Erwinia amylovora Ea644]|nr:hypothetical protein BN439_1813 [Erwinia amylovora Ea644]